MAPSRRQPPPRPERPEHTIPEKLHDIKTIERRITELEALDPDTVTSRFSDPKVIALQSAIDKTLMDVFGNDTNEYRRYRSAGTLDQGPLSMMSNRNDAALARRYLAEGRQKSLSLLNEVVRAIKEEIEREEALADPATAHVGRSSAAEFFDNRRVFIVHGRDGEMREAVARFLTEIGLVPVILHEQPNGGKTVIEKFEAHSEPAGFAIVLLSGDDEGRLKGDAGLASRARQNVILELGYFVGKLDRSRVCALKRGDLEVPSDIVGVVFEPYDDGGAWRQILARELQEAGYEIDWNKVMRR